MKNVMSREEAERKLYFLWENGELPGNFTEDHSEYEYAVKIMMQTGDFEMSDLY